MLRPHACPRCGAELSADATYGVCPRCLLGQHLSGDDPLGSAPDVTQERSRRSAPTGRAARGFRPPAPEELAEHFPQLEILELVGQGGMGAVYKARQRGLDRVVALKILAPAAAEDEQFAERFHREARALARLKHPHIVGVYDSGRSGPYFYLTMEFVDGVNLRQAMRAGNVSAAQALEMVAQICEALQYAHNERVVHRDIKPENVLLDARGQVKVADFGLAKMVDPDVPDFTLTATHQVMGTPRYMAPEQLEGARDVDHRADIYSLGVVFYELLTGELPLGRFAAPSKRVQVDVRLDEVVLRTLEKQPELRYQQANDLRTDVDGIRTGTYAHGRRRADYEYRSAWAMFGIPLLHIAYGVDPSTGRRRIARGFVAIGDRAIGGVAIGGFTAGVLSIGGFSIGLLSISGLALGLLAFGGLAVGGVACGGIAAGQVAVGGIAIAAHPLGGLPITLARPSYDPPATVFAPSGQLVQPRAIIGRNEGPEIPPVPPPAPVPPAATPSNSGSGAPTPQESFTVVRWSMLLIFGLLFGAPLLVGVVLLVVLAIRRSTSRTWQTTSSIDVALPDKPPELPAATDGGASYGWVVALVAFMLVVPIVLCAGLGGLFYLRSSSVPPQSNFIERRSSPPMPPRVEFPETMNSPERAVEPPALAPQTAEAFSDGQERAP